MTDLMCACGNNAFSVLVENKDGEIEMVCTQCYYRDMDYNGEFISHPNLADDLSEALGNSDGQTPDEIRKELTEEGVDVKGIEKRLNEFQEKISAYKQEDDKKYLEIFEWYWLFQDGNDIADYYYNSDSDVYISDEGLEEAGCITSKSWEMFQILADELRQKVTN